MRDKNIYGQEAIEFILITTLVFFGSLMVVLVFGNKIANFFTNDSSAIKAANASPTVIGISDNQKYNPDYTTSDNNKTSYQTAAEEAATAAAAAAAAAQKTSSGGTPYTLNTDGSVSFSVAGQNVMLSSDIVQLQDIVMQTSGSEGATSLVDSIAYIISQNKAAFPSTNVPIEISFGSGSRVSSSGRTTYLGNASVNTVGIKVGEDIVIIQNDQTCQGSDTRTIATCSYSGLYTVQGTLDSSGNLITNDVSAQMYSGYSYGGAFSGSTDSSNGLSISGSFQLYDNDDYPQYSWNIDFTDPANTFLI